MFVIIRGGCEIETMFSHPTDGQTVRGGRGRRPRPCSCARLWTGQTSRVDALPSFGNQLGCVALNNACKLYKTYKIYKLYKNKIYTKNDKLRILENENRNFKIMKICFLLFLLHTLGWDGYYRIEETKLVCAITRKLIFD